MTTSVHPSKLLSLCMRMGGFTKEELASLLQTTEAQLSSWQRGAPMDEETQQRVCALEHFCYTIYTGEANTTRELMDNTCFMLLRTQQWEKALLHVRGSEESVPVLSVLAPFLPPKKEKPKGKLVWVFDIDPPKQKLAWPLRESTT